MNIDEIFKLIISNAKNTSTCCKLAVGAGYLDNNDTLWATSNSGFDHNCKEEGYCYKYMITGIYESCEETRKYCKATHAEINLITLLNNMDINFKDGELFVTRYPCINCAKKISESGFKKVNYCGKQEISEEVREVFEVAGIEIAWYPEYDFEYGDN